MELCFGRCGQRWWSFCLGGKTAAILVKDLLRRDFADWQVWLTALGIDTETEIKRSSSSCIARGALRDHDDAKVRGTDSCTTFALLCLFVWAAACRRNVADKRASGMAFHAFVRATYPELSIDALAIDDLVAAAAPLCRSGVIQANKLRAHTM